ncbi:Cytochrome p450 [Thalictrum thalictroides]|uniref:Cytochrome p450 n=1 Tax=Thalictrum thalictroides TaxID=46969 RepID=A0A7J6WAP7_THATH|nr:Cytochrome p450 [Thalictrum thalictroides]
MCKSGDDHWALYAKSVLDRTRLALASKAEHYDKVLQPSAEYLGSLLDVDQWVTVFAGLLLCFMAFLIYSIFSQVLSPWDLMIFYFSAKKGLISFPVNIPGTTYYKCLQKAMKFLKHTLDERRASPEMHYGDFLDESYETTSSALTLGVKFLVEHPLVLEELKKEHEFIIRNRESQDTGLTWIEYKSMTFTFMVSLQSLEHIAFYVVLLQTPVNLPL